MNKIIYQLVFSLTPFKDDWVDALMLFLLSFLLMKMNSRSFKWSWNKAYLIIECEWFSRIDVLLIDWSSYNNSTQTPNIIYENYVPSFKPYWRRRVFMLYIFLDLNYGLSVLFGLGVGGKYWFCRYNHFHPGINK